MREWKVGRITLGLFLIGMGVLLALNTLTTIPLDRILSLGWPVLLIILGIEVLAYQMFHKNGNWSFDIFSIFLIFVAGVSILAVYTVQSVGVIPMLKNTFMSQAYTVEIKESLQIGENIQEIEIDIPNGDIQLIGTETKIVNLNGTMRTDGKDQQSAEEEIAQALIFREVGNKVIIQIQRPRNQFGWIPNQLATFSIEIPADLIVKAKVINGKISAKNFTKEVDVDGSNLTVDIDSVQGNVRVDNTNGKIDLRNIQGSVDAILTNGNINAKTDTIAGDWFMKTVNGGVTIQLPTNPQVDLRADTTNGRVQQNINDSNEKNFQTVIGAGTYKVEMKTTNGNIRIE